MEAIRKFNQIQEHDRKRRRMLRVVRILLLIVFFCLGWFGQQEFSSRMLYEEIQQTKKVMRDYPHSIVVLSQEAADALEYHSEKDADAKKRSALNKKPPLRH